MASPSTIAAKFIGRVLTDRYRLDSVLGTGGMGAVYAARDLKTEADLAIKVIHYLGPGTEEFHQRFFDEAMIIGQLFHPNIVQVIGFDRDKDSTPFLLMELLRGKDLYDVLEEREKLPLQKALEIARQVGSALHAAHNLGIAHRDIKPSNIFLSRQKNSDGEEGEVVKVVDFGLSKELDGPQVRRTAPGIILGTVEYVSPEGTTGESERVDFRSDQWALAVVTYRMLSGRLPFEGKNVPKLLTAIRQDQPTSLRTYVPDLPEHVVAAIERALSKEKDQRFESIQDFVRALNGLPSLSQSLSSAADGARAGRAGRRGTSSANIPIPGASVDSAAPVAGSAAAPSPPAPVVSAAPSPQTPVVSAAPPKPTPVSTVRMSRVILGLAAMALLFLLLAVPILRFVKSRARAGKSPNMPPPVTLLLANSPQTPAV